MNPLLERPAFEAKSAAVGPPEESDDVDDEDGKKKGRDGGRCFKNIMGSRLLQFSAPQYMINPCVKTGNGFCSSADKVNWSKQRVEATG